MMKAMVTELAPITTEQDAAQCGYTFYSCNVELNGSTYRVHAARYPSVVGGSTLVSSVTSVRRFGAERRTRWGKTRACIETAVILYLKGLPQ